MICLFFIEVIKLDSSTGIQRIIQDFKPEVELALLEEFLHLLFVCIFVTMILRLGLRYLTNLIF